MRASPEQLAAAVQALLKQSELSPEDTERRIEEAFDVDRWRRLAPFATIGGDGDGDDGPAHISDTDAAREKRRLDGEGYFRLSQVFAPARIARMRRIVEAVRADGWPVAFAFVFDEFWSIARSPQVASFLESAVGEGYLQNTVVWAHWVAGERRVAGWGPHDDYREGGDAFLSAWIPLSDATVENGCMFLLPAGVSREISDAIDTDRPLSPRVVRAALQDVIALPAAAGAMIGWRGNILHWGGANAGGAEPRLSLAIEFRAQDARTSKFERPLIDPRAPLPSFRLRLFAITKALREYTKFEPLLLRYLPLTERIFDETSDASAAVSNPPPAS
ncbi:phytanoyl-CoA dioxygenase family protein [Reyranella sp.]|uniref:phytanoyl-CoA dioxygenase family protein n=1 Tax=Reyranella sp. TaxID=1929291 RepID=UPI0027256142|nr:phytanoyl-CoA dioxygenase family protein [Reyranella sp.]MDO8976308.1 phytanoyl-CoA dioxygenase family protein [Reyranella sp.]